MTMLRKEALIETIKEGKYMNDQPANLKALSQIRILSDIY